MTNRVTVGQQLVRFSDLGHEVHSWSRLPPRWAWSTVDRCCKPRVVARTRPALQWAIRTAVTQVKDPLRLSSGAAVDKRWVIEGTL